jgi:very-short-patch-repair endonuclease
VSVGGSVDRRIAEISARQRGRCARRQLLAAGIGPGSITRRLTSGDLVARRNGVYATTPVVGGPWIAETEALLAARDGAVLSHLSALSLWNMTAGGPPGTVDVSVVRAPSTRRAAVRVHRVEAIDIHDVRFRRGLPVTAPSLSLIQSASGLGGSGLEDAFDIGTSEGLTTLDELGAALARAGSRTGTPLVRDLITDYMASTYTRSKAERLLLRHVGDAGFETPLTNVRREGFEVDALWPALGVVVEVDGFAYHGDRTAFERDRLRDQVLTAAGFTVIRVTWRQLNREPIAVMVRLGQILGAAGQRRALDG